MNHDLIILVSCSFTIPLSVRRGGYTAEYQSRAQSSCSHVVRCTTRFPKSPWRRVAVPREFLLNDGVWFHRCNETCGKHQMSLNTGQKALLGFEEYCIGAITDAPGTSVLRMPRTSNTLNLLPRFIRSAYVPVTCFRTPLSLSEGTP